jgi:hypothetical protein
LPDITTILLFVSSVLRCPLRFPHKNDVRLSIPPVVCRRAHVLIPLFVFVCVLWCPIYIVLCFCFVFLRLVYPMLPVSLNCFCFVCLRLVYPMLPVSLDCPFLITSSVFSLTFIHRQFNPSKNVNQTFTNDRIHSNENLPFT